MAFAPLDPILHNQLRLAVMSLLVSVERADFNWLLEKTGATRGNLSVQLSKLKDAGYIKVKKSFKDNYPNTACTITTKGVDAFEGYVKGIRTYLDQEL
ncbi:MAG: transcriptional regulator [Flavobacteriales bacterium]|nr:transcriptional regulator [Flavobacteriales bacterium]